MLNYIWGEVGRTNLIVHRDIMSYNPTPWQHLNAVSTSVMGIVSTLSDAGQTFYCLLIIEHLSLINRTSFTHWMLRILY